MFGLSPVSCMTSIIDRVSQFKTSVALTYLWSMRWEQEGEENAKTYDCALLQKKKVHLSSKSTQISTYDMQLFTSQHQYLPTIWGQVKDVRGRRKEIPSLDLLHSYCQG